MMCQGNEALLATAGGPVMDLASLPDLKPLCYSAASKLFASDPVGMGVVKNEPGVSGGGGNSDSGGVASNPHPHHHHHMLHPAAYHHGYHGYDPGTLASLHHSTASHS